MSQKIKIPKASALLRRMNKNRRDLEKYFKKEAKHYELSQKGKTGMQIINEFLNKAING